METVVVLGTGLVGNWIVRSLSSDGYRVIAIDSDKNVLSRLNHVAYTIHAIVDEDLINSLDADVFVNALPGRVGHRIRKILVEKGQKVKTERFQSRNQKCRYSRERAVRTFLGIWGPEL